MNRGVNVFFSQRLNQVCDLHMEDWWLPHDSQCYTQPGSFVNLAAAVQPWSSIWRSGWARWVERRAIYFSELPGTAALRALSCFPIRRALCNPPACYEHEVNKTLGHHKSLANDMSGAEIRQPEWSGGAQSGEGGLSPCSLQLLLSSSVPMCKIIIKIAAQLR